MNWKEFLELNRKKILIWFLIIIITFLIPFFTSSFQILIVMNPILYFFVYLVATLEMTTFDLNMVLQVSWVLVNGLLLSFCWYLLSCFIVFRWDSYMGKYQDEEDSMSMDYSTS
jgi:hypothetical protein